MPPKERITQFEASHEIEYDLMVTCHDPETGVVTPVMCQLCRYFGRVDKVGPKRKPMSVTKSFNIPFRPALYTQHHELQHPSR